MNETGTKQIAAVGFLVMAFTDETAADETLKEIKKAKQIIESLEELGCGYMLEQVEASEAHTKLLKEIGELD